MEIAMQIEHAGDGNDCVCFRGGAVDVPPLAELGGEGGKSKITTFFPLRQTALRKGFKNTIKTCARHTSHGA